MKGHDEKDHSLWIKAKIDGSPLSHNMEDGGMAERLAIMGAMMYGSLAAMLEDAKDATISAELEGGSLSVKSYGSYLFIKYHSREMKHNYGEMENHKLNIPQADEPV